MRIEERDWQHLWSRLEDVLGEGPAATLVEILDEAYRSVVDRDVPTASEPPPGIDAGSRHRLWRKLDEVIGPDAAAVLMLLLEVTRRERLATVA